MFTGGYPIYAHCSQKQPHSFDQISQAKAKLGKYFKEKKGRKELGFMVVVIKYYGNISTA